MFGWIYNWIWPQEDSSLALRTTRAVAIHTGVVLTLGPSWGTVFLALQWRSLVYYIFKFLNWF